ncbi:MAG: tectonin domain-containing protein [Rhodospirillaceae bacterium]
MQKQLIDLSSKFKWSKVEGAARDVGAGANNQTWVIGTNKEAGGYGIYRWDTGKWAKINGSAERIDVGPDGNAWVVNNKGEIFQHDGKAWKKMPGLAKDVGVGADGSVMVIGTDDSPYLWASNKWSKVPGKARNITVAANGAPWVVNAGHSIFGWQDAPKTKPGKPVDSTLVQVFPNQVTLFQVQHSKRCVDNSGSTSKGAKVQQWDCHNNANQLWRLDDRGKGNFRIVSKHSGKCLDVAEGKKDNRGVFHQWDCHTGGNQLFRLF